MNKSKIMKQLYTLIITIMCFSLSYAQPTTDAPVPTKLPENVVFIYSNTYGNVPGINTNPNWGQAGVGSASEIEPASSGNTALAYPGMNYQGIEFAAQTTVANMEYLHVDIWVPAGTTADLKITPINNGTGVGEFLFSMTYTAGQWSSIDIPKSSFTGMTWDSVFQVKMDGGAPTYVYVDNLYFWKEPSAAGTDASLSDITLDGTAISSFNSANTSYSQALVTGTATPPTVAATTTDTGANAVVTQATAIPGDATVIVTAADGNTTETYTISFYIGIPNSAPPTPTRDAANVISIYSDAYSSVATNMNPGWGQAGTVNAAYDTGDGNNLLVYSNFNYQGTEIASSDISGMNYLHIDIWVAPNDTRTVKVTPVGGGETLVAVTTTPGAWNSVDIPVSSFSGITTPQDVIQLKFDGQFAADGATADVAVRSDIYLDNIYFFSGTLSLNDFDSSFNIYPNPVNNRLNISAGAAINNVSIFDLTGREVLRATPNVEKTSLDVSSLNKGFYLLTVKSGNQELTTKLVK